VGRLFGRVIGAGGEEIWLIRDGVRVGLKVMTEKRAARAEQRL